MSLHKAFAPLFATVTVHCMETFNFHVLHLAAFMGNLTGGKTTPGCFDVTKR